MAMRATRGRFAAGVLLLGLLLGLLVGCGGNDSGGKTHADDAKPAGLGKLTVEPVADFPDRIFSDAFGDGTAIIADSENQSPDGQSSSSLVRLDTAGAITKETPLGSSNIYGFVETTAGTFAMGSFENEGGSFQSECGYREVDPTALTLAPTIKITDNGSCSGGGDMDGGIDGAVVWTADDEADTLVRADTASGAVTSVSLKDALPAGYDTGSAPNAIDGDVFVELRPRYDDATSKPVTDANGKPLPALVAKVDGASSKVTVKELPGFLNVTGHRMIVGVSAAGGNGPPTYLELDPKTLEFEDVGTDDLPDQQATNTAEGNGVSWSVAQTGEMILRVTQRDPKKGDRAVAEGELDTGLTASYVSPIAIGTDVFILVGSSSYDEATQKSTAASKLFKASAV